MSPRATGALSRLGGLGAILSGTVFLLTIGYTFGYLASLGLTVEMLDRPADLLPWTDRHTGAYLGLWWLYLLSLLLLLPAPLALYEPVARRDTAWARIGAAAGVGGVLIGLVGVAVNAPTAPILAAAYTDAPRADTLLLSEIVGALGLHLRLFADVLFAIWLAASGWVLVRLPGPWRAPGGAGLLVAVVVLGAAAAKLLGAFDLEAGLGLLLAGVYLWVGTVLLREAGRPATREAAEATRTGRM